MNTNCRAVFVVASTLFVFFLGSFQYTNAYAYDDAKAAVESSDNQSALDLLLPLGNFYYRDSLQPKELDETEKWDRFNREIDPDAWKLEEKRIALKKKQIRKRREKMWEQQRKETQESAQKAIDRFGLVGVSVIAEEKFKRFGTKNRKGLALGESNIESTDKSWNGINWDGMDWTTPLVVFVPPDVLLEELVINVLVELGVKTVLQGFQGLKDKAKIEAMAAALTKAFVQTDPEQDLTDALLATADRQQAPSLLVIDSEIVVSNARHQLVVQLERLRIFYAPGSRSMGHLWVVTDAELNGQGGGGMLSKNGFAI